MTFSTTKAVSLLAIVLLAPYAAAASESETNMCTELSKYVTDYQALKFPDPSRLPTKKEQLLIEKLDIELLKRTDYSMGTMIVDADNDGKNDLFVWNIEGSGRYVVAELFDIPAARSTKKLAPRVSLDLGVLQDPRFIRFRGSNYLVSTDSGSTDDISISRIAKTNGQYEQQTLCRMQTVLKPKTDCRHPACKKLKEVIEDKNNNDSFVKVLWSNKKFLPDGLAIYYPERGSRGDFDNSKNPTTIWRIGGDAFSDQPIYWTLLGQGDELPNVRSALQPMFEGKRIRRVLPGSQHDRLRRALAQQSEVLSRALHRPVSLPNEGEFFLFNANEQRTYWAWDFDGPPYGEELHITYTNATKSDYIGVLRVERTLVLAPCTLNCSTPLNAEP